MRRLIGAPKITQLHVDFTISGVAETFWIIYASLVPPFDLVGNHGRFFQCHSIKQRSDLRRSGCVRQSFISYRPDDLVPKRGIRLQRCWKSDRKKNRHEQGVARRESHFRNWPRIRLNSRLPTKIQTKFSVCLSEAPSPANKNQLGCALRKLYA